MPRVVAAVLVLSTLLAAAAAARAEAPPASDAPRSGSVLATGAALFPGILVPGVGQFVLGETEAGKRFLVLDAVGLGLIGVGFGGLAASGGADRVAALCLVPAVTGIALLSVAVLTDVIGSAHGTAPWPMPWEPKGSLALRLGYTGLAFSKVDFHHGLGLEAEWRRGGFSLTPSGMLDPSLSFYGLGLAADYVMWSASGDPVTRIGLGLSVTHHRFRFDRFSETSGELHGELRLNLRHLTPTMQNAYALARFGAGAEVFAYDGVPTDGSDLSPLLILEIGGGIQVSERVNLELVYRNRKDQLPGGVIFPGYFDSYLGFFEARGRVALADRWAVLAGVRWGNGLLPWISLESQLF